MTAILRVACATLVLAIAGQAFGLSDGPRSPSTIVNDAGIGTLAWSNPGNAAASDNLRASATAVVMVTTQALRATNFGFGVPLDAVITGIEVRVERSSALGLSNDAAVRIVKNGALAAAERAGAAAWPTTAGEAVATYGGTSDLWGETWTPAEINDSGFGAAVAASVALSDVAQVDHLAITVHYEVCGDGILSAGEDCDDGNTNGGDCCSPTCAFESSGSACADGDLCNGDETCDGAGTCLPGSAPDCADGNLCTTDACDAQLGCVNDATPRSGCRSALRSVLVHRHRIPDSRDRLVWKWAKGAATTTPEFGIPSGTTAYALCVFADTTLALSAQIPPDGIKWIPVGGEGYKYLDPTGSPDGVRKVSLRSSAAPRAKVLVKGRGTNLQDYLTPYALPVRVQMINDTTSACFEATYNAPAKNADGFLKAKQ